MCVAHTIYSMRLSLTCLTQQGEASRQRRRLAARHRAGLPAARARQRLPQLDTPSFRLLPSVHEPWQASRRLSGERVYSVYWLCGTLAPPAASSGASILRKQGSQKVWPQPSMRGRAAGEMYCSKQTGQSTLKFEEKNSQ